MPNSLDQQVVRDEMLETLIGGATDDLAQRVARLKRRADQIHAIDPDGPEFPTGSIAPGDMFDFTVEVGKWCSQHPGAKVDPITPPA